MKNLLPFVCALAISSHALAQNLAPNPSFEAYHTCPTGMNGGQGMTVKDWSSPNWYTPDYFNACLKTPKTAGTPENSSGYQVPKDGAAYIGCYIYNTAGKDVKEYIKGTLVKPLQARERYRVSVDISLADTLSNIACNGFGFLFFTNTIGGNYDSTEGNTIAVRPQVDYSSYGVVTNKLGWTTMVDTFTADSAFTHVVFGGFIEKNKMDTVQYVASFWTKAYYYIDNVKIESLTYLNSLGIDGTDANKNVSFAPNPFSETAVLRFNNPEREAHTLVIINSMGAIVRKIEHITGDEIKIHREALDHGIYYYQLWDKNHAAASGKSLIN
jgi:hypothetical protein